MIVIERVPYGKKDTPKDLREYFCLSIKGSPVGNISDWKDFAKEQSESEIRVIDFDESWVEKL